MPDKKQSPNNDYIYDQKCCEVHGMGGFMHSLNGNLEGMDQKKSIIPVLLDMINAPYWLFCSGL